MSSCRHLVWIAICCAGCASANAPGNSGPVDAPRQQGGGDGPGPDAPSRVNPDAPVGPLPDAPVSGGCTSPSSGVLATWSFSGQTGNEATVAASSSASGVTAGNVARSSGLTATTGSGSINSSNWPLTAQLDPTRYYTLTIAPPAGCALDLTSAAVDAKASASGPAMAAIATSADSYTQTSAVTTSAPSTPALAVSGATGMVEVRIYGFSASSTSGTLRLQTTLTLSGAVH